MRLAALGVALAAALGLEAAPNPIGEAQATAGFLFNCAMFVQWPGSAGTSGEIRLGIIGADPVVELIDEMQGRRINGRVLRVKSVLTSDDVRAFHILFVADEQGGKASEILARVGDAPVLTVGEEREFTAKGGIVRVYTDRDRLRFEVNLTQADRAGLQISATMLGLARIVR